MTLEETFVDVCQQVGLRVPLWIQGPGGNVSVKNDEAVFIKASGRRLDAVRLKEGYVRLPRSSCAHGLAAIGHEPLAQQASGYETWIAGLANTGAPRPSMETGFHVALPARWVIHVHALTAVVMAHHEQAVPGSVQAWLADATDLRCVFVPLAAPGWELAAHVARVDADVYILANHGVILQGQDADIVARWAALEPAFLRAWQVDTRSSAQAIPWHPYLPDSAVFSDRMQNILVPDGDDAWRARPDAASIDRDAWELWEAQRWLYGACPALAALPDTFASALTKTPAEIWRRAVSQPPQRREVP